MLGTPEHADVSALGGPAPATRASVVAPASLLWSPKPALMTGLLSLNTSDPADSVEQSRTKAQLTAGRLEVQRRNGFRDKLGDLEEERALALLSEQVEDELSLLRQMILERRAFCTISHIRGEDVALPHGDHSSRRLVSNATYKYICFDQGSIRTGTIDIHATHWVLPRNIATVKEILALREEAADELKSQPPLFHESSSSSLVSSSPDAAATQLSTQSAVSHTSRSPAKPEEYLQARASLNLRTSTPSCHRAAEHADGARNISLCRRLCSPGTPDRFLSTPSAADRAAWAQANLGGSNGSALARKAFHADSWMFNANTDSDSSSEDFHQVRLQTAPQVGRSAPCPLTGDRSRLTETGSSQEIAGLSLSQLTQMSVEHCASRCTSELGSLPQTQSYTQMSWVHTDSALKAQTITTGAYDARAAHTEPVVETHHAADLTDMSSWGPAAHSCDATRRAVAERLQLSAVTRLDGAGDVFTVSSRSSSTGCSLAAVDQTDMRAAVQTPAGSDDTYSDDADNDDTDSDETNRS